MTTVIDRMEELVKQMDRLLIGERSKSTLGYVPPVSKPFTLDLLRKLHSNLRVLITCMESGNFLRPTNMPGMGPHDNNLRIGDFTISYNPFPKEWKSE